MLIDLGGPGCWPSSCASHWTFLPDSPSLCHGREAITSSGSYECVKSTNLQQPDDVAIGISLRIKILIVIQFSRTSLAMHRPRSHEQGPNSARGRHAPGMCVNLGVALA
jgi:hypothetical protein